MMSPTVCRATNREVIKQMEEKYNKKFKILNNYAKELKAINFETTVIVITKNASLDSGAIFDRIYIFVLEP